MAVDPYAPPANGVSALPNTTWNVDPNQLVSNQLNGLLSSSNPYIANARAQGEQQAASRGMLNGSMAAGASENAAINAALPIATSDAGTYGHAAETNATNATQQAIERERANATLGAASLSASAQTYGDNTRYQTSQNALAQGAQEYNATWAHDQANQQTAEQFAMRNGIASTILNGFSQDPTAFMNSADGGQGWANFLNTNLFDTLGNNSTNTTQLPSGYGNITVPNTAPYRP